MLVLEGHLPLAFPLFAVRLGIAYRLLFSDSFPSFSYLLLGSYWLGIKLVK